MRRLTRRSASELVERGPHGRARGAECFGQLTFRRQLIAMAVLAGLNRLPQLSGDPGRPAHRVIHELHHGLSLIFLPGGNAGFPPILRQNAGPAPANNNQSNPFLCLLKNWFVTGLGHGYSGCTPVIRRWETDFMALPSHVKYVIVGAGIHGLQHRLAPGREPAQERQGQRQGHPGHRQDRDRGRRLRHRLRRGAQQLLPARHAPPDGAQRLGLGERPRGLLLSPGRLHADQPRGDARGRRQHLQAAEGDRLHRRPSSRARRTA